MKRENRGTLDLPILLVICIFLSLLTIGIGDKAIDRFDSLKNKQKAIRSFNRLIEKSTKICYGEVNNEIKINLDLRGRKIAFDKNIVQLKEGKEFIRSEFVPVPLKSSNIDNGYIESGSFSLKLTRRVKSSEKGLFIKIERYSQ